MVISMYRVTSTLIFHQKLISWKTPLHKFEWGNRPFNFENRKSLIFQCLQKICDIIFYFCRAMRVLLNRNRHIFADGQAFLPWLGYQLQDILFIWKNQFLYFASYSKKEMFWIYDNKHVWTMNSNPGHKSLLCLQS